MAVPVLSHRVVMKQEAKLKKLTPEEIIDSILHSVRVPMVDNYEKK